MLPAQHTQHNGWVALQACCVSNKLGIRPEGAEDASHAHAHACSGVRRLQAALQLVSCHGSTTHLQTLRGLATGWCTPPHHVPCRPACLPAVAEACRRWAAPAHPGLQTHPRQVPAGTSCGAWYWCPALSVGCTCASSEPSSRGCTRMPVARATARRRTCSTCTQRRMGTCEHCACRPSLRMCAACCAWCVVHSLPYACVTLRPCGHCTWAVTGLGRTAYTGLGHACHMQHVPPDAVVVPPGHDTAGPAGPHHHMMHP